MFGNYESSLVIIANVGHSEFFMLARISEVFASHKRILSVDDDPINQLVIQTCLEPEDYEVFQAMDGFEALTFLKENSSAPPDLILLDVMMPGMSGYEVCDQVRTLYGWAIPIIMISAKGKKEDVISGLSKGCNDYVVKPFDKTELLSRIQARIKLHIMTKLKHAMSHTQNTINNVIKNQKYINKPNNKVDKCHVLCLKLISATERTRHAIEAVEHPQDVIRLTSDVSQLLAFSESLAPLLHYAQVLLATGMALSGGIATGPLDTALLDEPGVLAFVGLGPAMQAAQQLAKNAVLATVNLCDQTVLHCTQSTSLGLNIHRKLLYSSQVPTENLVSASAAAAVVDLARSLDLARFKKDSVTDERVVTVIKLLEQKHSTRGDAEESHVRANLHAALDVIHKTTDENIISDALITVARSCSALFALGRSGASDPRVKERVEHLTMWLNELNTQLGESRKAANPILVAIEAEYAQIAKATEKLNRVLSTEKELMIQGEQLAEQVETVLQQADIIETQVASAYAQLVRTNVVTNRP